MLDTAPVDKAVGITRFETCEVAVVVEPLSVLLGITHAAAVLTTEEATAVF